MNISRFCQTIKTLALVAVVAMTSSCEDFLTIIPTDKVVLEDYWKTKTDVENMVANSYRKMIERSFTDRLLVWGELRADNVIEGQTLSGDIKNIMEANLLPQNGYNNWSQFYSIINNCNIVLRFAPQVMDEDPDFTQGDLDVTRGEMLAIRALCHFYLVRTFRDIPLLKEAMVDDSQNLYQAQATPIEALDFILEDLYEAEALVMESGNYPSITENKGRITKNAVRAMIADALLWKAAFAQYEAGGSDFGVKQYYTECIAFCDSVLNKQMDYVKWYEEENSSNGTSTTDEKYPLEQQPEDRKNADQFDPPYYKIFSMNRGNSLRESIFELQHGADKNSGNYHVPYFYGYGLTVGKLSVPRYMAEEDELYKKTDVRRITNTLIQEGTSADKYPITKMTYGYTTGAIGKNGITKEIAYKEVYTRNSGDDSRHYFNNLNTIIYRTSDVMLMKAEALALRNDSVGTSAKDLRDGFELVKAVYYRSNPEINRSDSITYKGGSEGLQELVLEERQRELAFEGKRWFDLVRKALRDGDTGPMLDIMVDHKYETNQKAIRSKMASMDCMFFPILEREINTNPLLKQNPAYEEEDLYQKN